MTARHSTKGTRRYRYYVCSAAQKRGWQTCPAPSVAAGAIERLVVEQLQGLGLDPALTGQEPGWEGMLLSDQIGVLRRLVGRVDYDGTHGRVSITLQPGSAQALADESNYQPMDDNP
jgi:hypothetical protein